ncbi:hypothetical protein FKM82_024208 [Ascaphus truei]
MRRETAYFALQEGLVPEQAYPNQTLIVPQDMCVQWVLGHLLPLKMPAPQEPLATATIFSTNHSVTFVLPDSSVPQLQEEHSGRQFPAPVGIIAPEEPSLVPSTNALLEHGLTGPAWHLTPNATHVLLAGSV